MGELATFAAGRMTVGEYRKERERIEALLKGTQATAHADQELAALFARSGWTQAELANAEQKSEAWVSRRLQFGQFLDFLPVGKNAEWGQIQATLTERRFRAYWLLTSSTMNDRQRFLAVQQLLLQARDSHGQRKGVGELIARECADGEWHRTTTIVERVRAVDKEATEADVKAVLDGMAKHRWYRVIAESRSEGRAYRLLRFQPARFIDVSLLTRELAPILERLKAEGGKETAYRSPGTVREQAILIERLIERLASQQSSKDDAPPEE